MKKISLLAILLAIVILFVACDTTTAATEPESIELTVDNFRDYFNISCTYGTVGTSGTSRALGITFVEVIITVNKVVSGYLNGVNIILKVRIPDGWTLSSNDFAYLYSSKEFEIYATIPANGRYSETHRIEQAAYTASKPMRSCSVKITSVSGTFTPVQ